MKLIFSPEIISSSNSFELLPHVINAVEDINPVDKKGSTHKYFQLIQILS